VAKRKNLESKIKTRKRIYLKRRNFCGSTNSPNSM